MMKSSTSHITLEIIWRKKEGGRKKKKRTRKSPCNLIHVMAHTRTISWPETKGSSGCGLSYPKFPAGTRKPRNRTAKHTQNLCMTHKSEFTLQSMYGKVPWYGKYVYPHMNNHPWRGCGLVKNANALDLWERQGWIRLRGMARLFPGPRMEMPKTIGFQLKTVHAKSVHWSSSAQWHHDQTPETVRLPRLPACLLHHAIYNKSAGE